MQREWMYLSNIFIFPIPCISKVKHLSLLWHNSPPSMEQAKLSLEWQHCLQLKRLIHFYCLPLGLQRQPWPEKQEEEVLPGGSPTNSVGQCLREHLGWPFHTIYVEHSFWNLLVGVVVTMILIKNWKKQKSWRNFWTISGLKISANPVPKNPGIPGLKILILLGPGKGSTF